MTLSFFATIAYVSSCDTKPGCVIYPSGCQNSDKMCCTEGWNTNCVCCKSTTPPQPTSVTPTSMVTGSAIPTLTTVDVKSTTSVTRKPTESSATGTSSNTILTTDLFTTVLPETVYTTINVFVLCFTVIIITIVISFAFMFIYVKAFRTFVFNRLNSSCCKRTVLTRNLVDLTTDDIQMNDILTISHEVNQERLPITSGGLASCYGSILEPDEVVEVQHENVEFNAFTFRTSGSPTATNA